jgi:hypothetical protein
LPLHYLFFFDLLFLITLWCRQTFCTRKTTLNCVFVRSILWWPVLFEQQLVKSVPWWSFSRQRFRILSIISPIKITWSPFTDMIHCSELCSRNEYSWNTVNKKLMNQISTRATRHADFLFSLDRSLYRCLNVHSISVDMLTFSVYI